MLVRERLQRQPRIAPTITALVHDVLDPGNAELRDDLVGGPQQHLLQLARLLPLALAKELVERCAFLRERAGQGQNGSARTHREAWEHRGRGTHEHLKLRWRPGDHLRNAMNISGAVLYTDNVLMFGERDSLGRFQR